MDRIELDTDGNEGDRQMLNNLRQFEALDGALNANLMNPTPRNQSKLFDLCMSLGMPFDCEETEWASERVLEFLRKG
jgi:hypothetical protein